MSRISYILILFGCLSLAACASYEKKAPEIKEDFVTEIDQSGLKSFSYTVTMAMPEGKNGGMRGGGMKGGGMRGSGMGGGGMRGGGSGMRGGGMGGGGMRNEARPSRESMMHRVKGVVYEKLKMKLAETGYCRESYTELDNYFVRGRSQIRGECIESATEEDRVRFVNNKNT